jgi:hypothetical protein
MNAAITPSNATPVDEDLASRHAQVTASRLRIRVLAPKCHSNLRKQSARLAPFSLVAV